MWSRVVNQELDEEHNIEERNRTHGDFVATARLEERGRHFDTLKYVFCGFVINGVGAIIFLTWKAYAVVYMLGIPAVVFLVLSFLEIIDLIRLSDRALPGLHPSVVQNSTRPPPQYSRFSPDQLSPTNLYPMQVPFTQDEISSSVSILPVDQPPPYSEVAASSSNSAVGNGSIYVISISRTRERRHDNTDSSIEVPREHINSSEGLYENFIDFGNDPPSYEDALAAETD